MKTEWQNERLKEIREMLDKLGHCPCNMCSDCIDLLCEEIIPAVEEADSLQARVRDARVRSRAGS